LAAERARTVEPPWLRVESATKVYGGVVALDSASLETAAGEIHGLVGANGAGKSTLVKVLTGLVAPTAGRVLVDGRPLAPGRPRASLEAGITAVPQELTVAPSLTVAENILLGHEPRNRFGLVRRREVERRAADLLQTLELELDARSIVGALPLLERRLVMIARALARDARLVIFDEPTATVSPREVDLLLRTIRGLARRGVSVLYVSHRLDEIEDLCDRVTVLRDGRVAATLAAARRAALVDLLAPTTAASTRDVRPEPGAVLVRARGVAGERLRGVDVDVRAGEIVGLAGLAGSGARELLLAVCGAATAVTGEITVAGTSIAPGGTRQAVAAGVAFVAGDRSLSTFPTHSIRHNVTLPTLAGVFPRPRTERTAVAELLARVRLAADSETTISSLSGGNQQKAVVARWIAAGARVLLLDDPTAGVDVATRPELHREILRLRDGGAAVLLVSTDVEELALLADRVLTLDRGRIVSELAAAGLTTTRLLRAMTEKAAPAGEPA
jgi:ABC-type sugar transport system ATPase subunit